MTGSGSVSSAAFDLQAHRGGIGLTVENTLAAFRAALAIGVTTLECDVNISADGVAMVTHDRVVHPEKCRDTGSATYVGQLVSRLTCAQLKTLDCGSQTLPAYPSQRAVPGAPMPTFAEMLALVATVPDVRVNVEAKYDALHPDEVAPRAAFADATLTAIHDAGLVDRVSVQSFDWETLQLVGDASPATPLYALTAPTYPRAGADDVVAAVAALGFAAISPAHGVPFLESVDHPSYVAFTTAELVADAHQRGLLVVPYTVDHPALLESLLDMGVDGVITNYPDRARTVLAARGVGLPPVRRPDALR